MILAGDVGGTSTLLGLFEHGEPGLELIADGVFASADYYSLEEIIKTFLENDSGNVDGACFGVPGPVQNGKAKLPNLPWIVESSSLRETLGRSQVWLINDLEANAYGLNELTDSDFFVLNQGEANPNGNAAIISAGTGLGEAGMHNNEGRLIPFATEGGHADFAPRNELEIELLSYLIGKFGNVSFERVLSGQGFVNIYEFLRDTNRAEEPEWLALEIANQNEPAAAISKNALAGKAKICEQTLDIFISLYGAEAGNLALKMLATNGIYVGGGIAPKVLSAFKTNAFVESFTAKGRMSSLLEKIPIRIVLNDKAAFLGAAHYAQYNLSVDRTAFSLTATQL